MIEQYHITLMSFGFKYGQPRANYYFDVGWVKNPARSDEWGFFSEVDEEMKRFVLEQVKLKVFLFLARALIRHLAHIDTANIFAFGCSAGRHRSPIIVEELATGLREDGYMVRVIHRETGAGAMPAPCPKGTVSWQRRPEEGWSPCTPGEWIPPTDEEERQ